MNEKILEIAHKKTKALIERNSSLLEEILHPNFKYINSQGKTLDKKAYLEQMIEVTNFKWKSQQYQDVSITVHGDIGILHAELLDEFNFKGKDYAGKFKTIQIYQKENSTWKWWQGITVEVL